MNKLTPFGKMMRKYRIDRGETQLDVADAIDVSVAFYSAIETGKKNIPDTVLNKLISHLELPEEKKAEFRHLAWISQKEVKINLQNANGSKRELAAGFARKFTELSEEQIEGIRSILKN